MCIKYKYIYFIYFCPLCWLFIRSSALGSVFVGLLLTASVVATAIKERRYPGNVLSWVNILINIKFFKKTLIYLFFLTYLVLFLQLRYKLNVLIIVRNLNLILIWSIISFSAPLHTLVIYKKHSIQIWIFSILAIVL